MEKLYKQLQWLDIGQAVNFLQLLTNTPLSENELLQLGRSRQLDVYIDIDPRGLTGKNSDNKEQVTLTGMQQVLNPDKAFEQSEDQTCAVLKLGDAHWIGLLPRWSQKAVFKSADIQALADKMNEVTEQAKATDLKDLRQQLLQARAEINYWQERYENERYNREQDLEYEHLLSVEKQQQYESMLNMKQQNQHEPVQQKDPQSSKYEASLTFPYATKELRAMRDASVQFWAEHDLSKPAPYGIQKQVQNFLTRRTGENSRKVAELAAAIKPDDLPRT
jgi:hypothetical protein